MAIARGLKKIEIWYLDPQDAKQHIVIQGDEGGYEISGAVARIFLRDRTMIVPLDRVIMIDDRLE